MKTNLLNPPLCYICLKRGLSGFGCEYAIANAVQNAIQIGRVPTSDKEVIDRMAKKIQEHDSFRDRSTGRTQLSES